MSLAESERLLSPRQLASYLNVSVATVYDWRHRRCGPPGFRIGKHVRYRRSDVDRWIEEQIETTSQGSR
jgi:excisionase family DNA binding protein